MAAAAEPAEGLLLDARLAAVGAPADLPKAYHSAWLIVAEAPPPTLYHAKWKDEDGVEHDGTFLKEAATHLHTHGFNMKLEWSGGTIYTRCRIAGCRVGRLRLSYDDRIKMKGYLDHLLGGTWPEHRAAALRARGAARGGARREAQGRRRLQRGHAPRPRLLGEFRGPPG
jgi:hypothetical protein